MKRQIRCSLMALALMTLGACNRSDTDMQEAFWCGSYGTCKPAAVAYQPKAANSNTYYGGSQQQRAPAYDACAFYGICDRGS